VPELQFARRRFGKTDLTVTEIGLGTGTIAGLFSDVPEAQGMATIRRALEAGIGYVDTSPFYGFGKAEHVTGNVLRGAEPGIVLSTKVGRLLRPYAGTETERAGWVHPLPFEPHYDYSYDGIMRSVADSRQRLGLTRIDILYVHDIGTMNHGVEGNRHYWGQLRDGGYRALRELRDSGAVKAIGLGVNETDVLMDALELGDWDVFLVAGRYTLLDQSALSPLLAQCVSRGTSIVIGGVFNSGALVGNGLWNYAAAPQPVLERVGKLAAFCRERNVPLAAAALQMPLAHPVVCSVLAGSKSPEELDQVLGWAKAPIAREFWSDLARSGLLAAGTPLPFEMVAE
jgi:D-threo-aldose 1-dehydrogenase